MDAWPAEPGRFRSTTEQLLMTVRSSQCVARLGSDARAAERDRCTAQYVIAALLLQHAVLIKPKTRRRRRCRNKCECHIRAVDGAAGRFLIGELCRRSRARHAIVGAHGVTGVRDCVRRERNGAVSQREIHARRLLQSVQVKLQAACRQRCLSQRKCRVRAVNRSSGCLRVNKRRPASRSGQILDSL